MPAARLALVVLIGLGVLGYSAWLLEFLLPTGVSPIEAPVEDLMLARPLFRIAVGVAGLAFLAAGPPLMRLAPVHWTGRTTAVSVAGFGIVLLVDAGVPGAMPLPLLQNVLFAVGTVSLVLWWPPGWRAWAVGALVLVLLTWALVLFGPAPWRGVFSRAQLVVRSAELIIGGVYVVRMPLSRSRKMSVPGEMLRSTRPTRPK
ncbi:hypothetical protein GCM10022222_26570 [Amycolatopsis ultiminotia]|uniref:DUF998 domain-containing protein n=1 Tax=Amycolatopsis ultiminotia TaxID=543629 RepID=A0ABP6VZB2_9PSEU